jgi:hypothetical protein
MLLAGTMVSGTDTALIGWRERIGPTAAGYLRSRVRALIIMWTCSAAGALLSLIGVLSILTIGTGNATGPQVLVIGTFWLLGIFSLLTAIGAAGQARRSRFRAEGAALHALLPQDPQLTAFQLAPHLRDLSRFDAWASAQNLRAPLDDQRPLPQWTWNSADARRILRGRTAAFWRGLSTGVLLAGLATACVWCLTIATGTSSSSTHVIVLLIVVAFQLCAASAIWLVSVHRARSEYRAGYTTFVVPIYYSIVDARTGVDLVDPKTGYLIRAAGALPLTTSRYSQRKKLVRTTHPGAKPTYLS